MRGQRGFTLLEVLGALTILGSALLVVFLLFPSALRVAKRAGERRVVSEAARSVLGQTRAAGAENLMENKFTFLDQILPNAETHYHTVQRTSVQRIRGGGHVALQRVTFTAEMDDGRFETFVTYVARQ